MSSSKTACRRGLGRRIEEKDSEGIFKKRIMKEHNRKVLGKRVEGKDLESG